MPSRQRYVVLAVLGLAAVLAGVLIHGLQWGWTQLGWPDPSLAGARELSLTSGIGVGIAALAATLVLRLSRPRQLAEEIVEELGRVSWPARDETVHATWVVVAAVVVCSAYLGVFDALCIWMSGLVLGVQGSI